jgi:hypothetical protein
MRYNDTQLCFRKQARALLPAVLLALAALGMTSPACAVTVISSDTTITNSVSDDYLVTGTATLNIASCTVNGDVTAADSSTVNLLEGGTVTGKVITDNSSRFILSGSSGRVEGALVANDTSSATVYNGTIPHVSANNNCTVSIYGGIIGGEVGMLILGGTVNIYGGLIEGSSVGIALEAGTLNISGGAVIGGDGVSWSGGTATISGGQVSGNPNSVVLDNIPFPGAGVIIPAAGSAAR